MRESHDVYKNSMAQQNWKPRSARKKTSSGQENRNEKRSRIGNRIDRAITKSAKGHLHPKWPALCQKADNLNK